MKTIKIVAIAGNVFTKQPLHEQLETDVIEVEIPKKYQQLIKHSSLLVESGVLDRFLITKKGSYRFSKYNFMKWYVEIKQPKRVKLSTVGKIRNYIKCKICN